MTVIGLDFYGTQFFRSPGSVLKNISYVEMKNCIVDEFSIRENTENVNTSPDKDEWDIDTKAIFQFLGDLEGGNIQNSGLKIVSFQIRRRKANELNGYTLDTVKFINGETIEYTDYTQSNEEYIYSIVPLAENALDGKSISIKTSSDFTGFWLIDKTNNISLPFDKSIGDVGDIETSLNQGRTVIETLSKYPSIFYSEGEFHEFELETVIIPSEFERSGIKYEEFINSIIKEHRPFLIKSSNGKMFVCDVHSPTFSTPKNTWKGYDYGVLKISCTEIGGYDEYMRGEI
ncbi:hypothetical protein F4V43_02590 [Paenibacillus spiritus]|uniref:Uncharacterized protein n=1 Tax=Paenibacillus spiritus TaxID=2496557 RepID=A0A5J5GGX5_9BACL|nr:hypothetical protein [Paenibacillus spiritus]KAA9007395.1 hypothetical protein F4V43_02590 [Paenibacillus spiritus]